MDYLMATGGTMKAAVDLCNKCKGARVTGTFVLFEVLSLGGREKIENGGKIANIVELGKK